MVKRILVIDDDEAIRKVFLLALEGTGYLVDTASSGSGGVESLKQQPYDLIYLDLKMPGMDGVETLRRLKCIDDQAIVYIITAYFGEYKEELENARKDGFEFELMKKPLTSAQLLSITNEILGEE